MTSKKIMDNYEPPVLRTCPSILITVTWHDGHLDESDPWLLIRLNLLFQLNLQPVQFNCEFSQSWNLEIYISPSLVFWGKVGKVVPIEGGHWMTIPKFWPKPIPRLFLWYQIFRNRNWDFFPRPNFFETETDTFLPRPNFSETETFFPRPNFSKPKPKPSKIWQKSRDRDLNRDFSTSFEMKFGKFGTYKQNWNFWDQNLGL